MSQANQVIRISLNIEAPVGTVVDMADNQKNPSGRRLGSGVTHPSSGVTPAKVSGSGATSGEICVKGNTATSSDKIFVSLNDINFPSAPFATTDSGGNWQGTFGGVSCGPSTAPVAHVLRVWVQDHTSGVVQGPDAINFQAFCAPYHECETPSSAKPVGTPVAWPTFRIVATGFQKDRAHFNGEYVLKLCSKQTSSSSVVWSQSNQPEKGPRVTLRLIRSECPHWQLEFSAGKDQITYHKSAADWNAIGANVLTQPSCGCGTASPSVQVHPSAD